MVCHFVAGFLSILALFLLIMPSIITLVEAGLVITTLIQLLLLLESLRGLSFFKESYALMPFDERDCEIQSIQVWMEAEVLLRVGIMFACIVYMLIRKF